MMNEELLELAAKAAGYRVKRESSDGLIVWIDDAPRLWNPRDDNEDAFLLAIKLGMCINCHATQVEYSKGNGQVGVVVENTFRDPSATRLAIFKAAVEIGRRMK